MTRAHNSTIKEGAPPLNFGTVDWSEKLQLVYLVCLKRTQQKANLIFSELAPLNKFVVTPMCLMLVQIYCPSHFSGGMLNWPIRGAILPPGKGWLMVSLSWGETGVEWKMLLSWSHQDGWWDRSIRKTECWQKFWVGVTLLRRWSIALASTSKAKETIHSASSGELSSQRWKRCS